MKHKILNVALILTSVLAYLEWGHNNSTFLLFAEADIIAKLFTDPLSAVHPFTVIPLIGQLILFTTLFQKQPGKILTFIGMGCIGILLLFICIIGTIGPNFKILVSTLPFLFTAVITIVSYRKSNKTVQ